MKDSQILDLYWRRDEIAISETIAKYDRFCRSIAGNILCDERNVEECVNDTWMKAWESIPPQRPQNFRAWLGAVVRNLAINCFKKEHRWKRSLKKETETGMEQLLAELAECIPSAQNVEHTLEVKELTELINTWLGTLSEDDANLFLRRYWNGEPVKNLARERGMKAAYIARRLQLLREKLKKMLEEEGYVL
ncbi:MAG: sigma-70 family RNA polymerase sigma factor [Lachnospiraceae bacterium]|nr:sigma-70 family RNA polymerase sigma factor [Lachnospiraceae bacterium]